MAQISTTIQNRKVKRNGIFFFATFLRKRNPETLDNVISFQKLPEKPPSAPSQGRNKNMMNNNNNMPKLFFSEWITSSDPHINYSSDFTDSMHINRTQNRSEDEELMMINNSYSSLEDDVMFRTDFQQPHNEYANYYTSEDFFINSDVTYI